MADPEEVVVLEFPEVEDLQDEDILYLLRGIGLDRDKKIKAVNVKEKFNHFINPGFTVNQRRLISDTPTNITSGIVFTEMLKLTSGNADISIESDIPADMPKDFKSLKLTGTFGTTQFDYAVYQGSSDKYGVLKPDILKNDDATFSLLTFRYKTDAPAAEIFAYKLPSTALASAPIPISATWSKITLQIPKTFYAGGGVDDFIFRFGNIPTGKYFQITDIEVYTGSERSVPIPLIENEKQYNQRYYYQINGSADNKVILSEGSVSSTVNDYTSSFRFPVEMIKPPTIVTTGTASDYLSRDKSVDVVSTSLPEFFWSTTKTTGYKHISTTASVLGSGIQLRLEQGADKFIGFDSNLFS